ncbi:FliA/WhiG family RNA polymerase sigma factor [Niallia taxi]|uniref:FliA/WhiG family RNA polymerase sigma factor n=1 Tax=Niallia taxi TaxID=2499688 RepID=UPI0015F49160|nr:FliA/WhiG family RNA polymerase sigma factor [Niallia taxi]
MSERKWTQLDTVNLLKWRNEKDQDAIQCLLDKYGSIVDTVVRKVSVGLPKNVDREELRQYGTLGLLDALDKFEVDRNLQFETYATWRIRGQIVDALRSYDWLPRSIREKARKIEKAYVELEQENQRAVSDREISEYLGISEEEVIKTKVETSNSYFTSIDEPVSDEDGEIGAGRLDTIASNNIPSPEEELHSNFVKDLLFDAIQKLPEKERIIIQLAYYEQMTLTEIAEIINLSSSRTSQLHIRAVKKLQTIIAREKELVAQA